jgi:hypothetical protein
MVLALQGPGKLRSPWLHLWSASPYRSGAVFAESAVVTYPRRNLQLFAIGGVLLCAPIPRYVRLSLSFFRTGMTQRGAYQRSRAPPERPTTITKSKDPCGLTVSLRSARGDRSRTGFKGGQYVATVTCRICVPHGPWGNPRRSSTAP